MTHRRIVNWGVLGPGAVASQFTGDIARSGSSRCLAVGSRSLQRAQDFAARHSLSRAYGSYEDLVADHDVDVVYVATPHSEHHRHGRLALEHGKSVLIEKPMAMSFEQTQDLIDLARAYGLFLMEGLWTLCNPLVQRLIELAASGPSQQATALTAQCGPLALPADHRALDPTLGAGFHREVLVYPLALWSALTGCAAIDRVEVATLSHGEVDTATSVTVITQDGRIANVAGSFALGVANGAGSRFQVLLRSGWADMDDVFAPTVLRVATTTDYTEQRVPSANGFIYEINEVVAAVTDQRIESPLVTHALSLHLARLLDDVANYISHSAVKD